METPRDRHEYTEAELEYWRAIRQWSGDLRNVRSIEMEIKAISRIAVPLDDVCHQSGSILPPTIYEKAVVLLGWCEVRLERLQHSLIDARASASSSYKQIPSYNAAFTDEQGGRENE